MRYKRYIVSNQNNKKYVKILNNRRPLCNEN